MYLWQVQVVQVLDSGLTQKQRVVDTKHYCEKVQSYSYGVKGVEKTKTRKPPYVCSTSLRV